MLLQYFKIFVFNNVHTQSILHCCIKKKKEKQVMCLMYICEQSPPLFFKLMMGHSSFSLPSFCFGVLVGFACFNGFSGTATGAGHALVFAVACGLLLDMYVKRRVSEALAERGIFVGNDGKDRKIVPVEKVDSDVAPVVEEVREEPSSTQPTSCGLRRRKGGNTSAPTSAPKQESEVALTSEKIEKRADPQKDDQGKTQSKPPPGKVEGSRAVDDEDVNEPPNAFKCAEEGSADTAKHQPVQGADESKNDGKVEEHEPEELLCPILQSLMTDPVITSDGFTYERSAIQHWLKNHNTSPKTGKGLKNKNCIPNHIVRAQIQDYRKKNNLPEVAPWEPPKPEENAGTRGGDGNNPQSRQQQVRVEIRNNRREQQQPLSRAEYNQLYHMVCDILNALPAFLQDYNRIHNSESSIPDAAKIIMGNPRMLRPFLPHINDQAKAFMESVIERLEAREPNRNGGGSSSGHVHPIFEAIEKEDVTALQRFLPSEVTGHRPWPGVEPWPSLNCRDPNGNTLLIEAARTGKLQCVQYLLSRNADVHTVNRVRSTALHVSSFYGHHKIVSELLKAGADPKKRMMHGDTPLHQAAWNGHVETLKVLLESNGPIDAKKEDGATALHLAAVRRQCNTVKFLLEQGANPLEKDLQDNLPMHQTASNGCQHSITYLMNADKDGVAMLSRNKIGNIPMHIAAWKGNLGIVKAMVNHDSDCGMEALRVGDKDKCTTINLACLRGHSAMVQFLIEKCKKGVDFNHPISDRGTPLHLACSMNTSSHLNIVKMLLHGTDADVSRQGENGVRPIHVAVLKNCPPIAMALLDHGADINARTTNGETPLIQACCSPKSEEIAHALIRRNANLNLQREDGRTALMVAIQNKMVKVCEELLSAGADPNIPNVGGVLAIDIAAQLGLNQLVEVLRCNMESKKKK